MSNPAPGELELVRGFVNTWDGEDRSDVFTSPEALRAWLAEHELLDPGAGEPTAGDLEHAVAVREALRAMLRANHGHELDPAAPATLDEAARRAQLTVRFTPTAAAAVEPLADGVDGSLGRLLARVAAAMDDGTWPRLKVCPADDCQWAFYDRSRNRSAVWCDMKVCGNRHKVRTFRERQRS
ncbi:MAG TPA: CGNR zinc finger domain-containing protein [Capillimicrobium sp.]|jgi:predicted RNA-binding Zn ribbon-like protein